MNWTYYSFLTFTLPQLLVAEVINCDDMTLKLLFPRGRYYDLQWKNTFEHFPK